MERHELDIAGVPLSYLDAGGPGQPLIALHAHLMEGQTYAPLAAALAPTWRVIAPDQRGHGASGHTSTYATDDYLDDLDVLVAHLGLTAPFVVLGNSLGGVNAFEYAARRPERVRGLVIEDIGAVIADDTRFVLAWGGVFETREALEAAVGARFVPTVRDSIRYGLEGWYLAFDPQDMVTSQQALNGDHWASWLATSCPALIVRGAESRVSHRDVLVDMARRRPNTQLVEIPGGHVVHADNPGEFAATVRQFLDGL